MAEVVKDFWAGMPWGMYLILILAIGIGIAGFIVPPIGVISGSLLKFIAMILGGSWLFYITANIPTILANGAKIRAEYGNAKIERVILEDGLRSIPPFMFSGCKNLEEVELPESVTAIAAWSFNGCRKLKKITFERKDKINITELLADCPDLVFYGHKDSFIQKYAEENSIPFEVLE